MRSPGRLVTLSYIRHSLVVDNCRQCRHNQQVRPLLGFLLKRLRGRLQIAAEGKHASKMQVGGFAALSSASSSATAGAAPTGLPGTHPHRHDNITAMPSMPVLWPKATGFASCSVESGGITTLLPTTALPNTQLHGTASNSTAIPEYTSQANTPFISRVSVPDLPEAQPSSTFPTNSSNVRQTSAVNPGSAAPGSQSSPAAPPSTGQASRSPFAVPPLYSPGNVGTSPNSPEDRSTTPDTSTPPRSVNRQASFPKYDVASPWNTGASASDVAPF